MNFGRDPGAGTQFVAQLLKLLRVCFDNRSKFGDARFGGNRATGDTDQSAIQHQIGVGANAKFDLQRFIIGRLAWPW